MSPQTNKTEPINESVVSKKVLEGNTLQGQVVQPVTSEIQMPLMKANKPIDKRLADRIVSETDQDISKIGIDAELKEVANEVEQLVAKSEIYFDEDFVLSDMDMGFYNGKLVPYNLSLSSSNDFDKIRVLKDDFQRWKSAEVGSAEYQDIQEHFQQEYSKTIPGQLSLALIKQLYQKGVSPESLCEHATFERDNLSRKKIKLRKKMFEKELLALLKDMDSRGIGISSKMSNIFEQNLQARDSRKVGAQYNALKHIEGYVTHFYELAEFDVKFDAYLKAGGYPVWNCERPLYRGGRGGNERKMIRNLKKEKPVFRRDLINKGNTLFGYGQYYAQDIEEASTYAVRYEHPVIVTAYIKPGTPHINAVDPKLISHFYGDKPLVDKEASDFSSQKLDLEGYFGAYVKHAIINEVVPKKFYTLSKGSIINSLTVQAQGDIAKEGPKSVGELSVHRLDEDGCVFGKPEVFEEVKVLNEANLESTDFISRGYKPGELLSVFKYQKADKTLYVVKSPEKENTFWQVKQMPESLNKDKPEFIIEPVNSFLAERKREKLALMNSEENREIIKQKAEENRELLRSCFEMACAVRVGSL